MGQSATLTRTPAARPRAWMFLTFALILLTSALILLAFALALPLGASAASGWNPQTSAATGQFYDVSFVDSTHGWAVGLWGAIYVTTNGGATWSAQSSGVTTNLYDVSFIDASRGWATGAYGVIVKTTNGGATWTKQGSGWQWTDFFGVAFTDENHAWIAGSNPGVILATGNGGTSWSQQTTGSIASLRDVDFGDATHGWAVGAGGTILATANGATWVAQTSGVSGTLYGVAFADALHGWAVGDAGTILATTNGGATWGPQTSGTTKGLLSVAFVDTTHGWAVGGSGTILATTNGGTTWSAQSSGTAEQLEAVNAPDSSHAWAVGWSGTILASTGGGIPVIGITAPTAASSWPSGSTQTVSWKLSSAVSTGEFRIWLVNPGGTWYVGKQVLPTAGLTGYSTAITAGVPAAVGYKAYVYWRPVGGSGGWTATAQSAAFTVTPILITSPTVASVWPSGSPQTVSWTVNPTVSTGEFRVWLVSPTGTWYIGKQMLPTGGRTSYSASLTASVPAAGGYKAYVYWRPTVGNGGWTATAQSAAFAVAPIYITNPTASSSWKTGSTQTVSWTINPAVSAGEFRVWLVSPSGIWYVGKQVLPTAGLMSYSTAVTAGVPAAAGYKAYVYWRPTVGSGGWTATAQSAAFTVTP